MSRSPFLARAEIAASVMRVLVGVVVGCLLLIVLAAFSARAHAGTGQAPTQRVRIPEVPVAYRLTMEREAERRFGLDAPVARLAAQIHQESAWRPAAESPFAQGLAQFTPATARWIPSVCADLDEPDPWDPYWSLRAQACYMAWLERRIVPYRYAGPMAACTRWNFALRGYNGGEGWLNKERMATQRAGGDANDWRDVELHRVRADWAHRENTHYPRRILLVLEPAYRRAGWPGKAVCA